jgi:hypothetical protein
VCLRIELETRQYFLMADAATRILVHALNELRDSVFAIAHNVTRGSARRRHQLAMHDQQPMIITFQEGFHDHRT